MKNDSKEVLELYFKSLYYKKELEIIEEKIEKIQLNFDNFEKIYMDELQDLEKDIIKEYHLEKKSLKKLASELGYSYPYVRKVYMEAKEKMRIIISIHIKNINEDNK